MRKIEVCCNSVEDALNAQKGGAVRVELCSALGEGGVTPSAAMIREVVARCADIEVNVLVRPREGDFLYNESEIDVICGDIRLCREWGADGVVIGALDEDGNVDTAALERMVSVAKSPVYGDGGQYVRPLSVTFHRAFDVCRNPLEALETVIAAGCDRILTSGCRQTVMEGAELISELVKTAGNRIIIMPGSGVRPSNIVELQVLTGAVEFHSSARVKKGGGMKYRNPFVSFSAGPEEEAVRFCVSSEITAELAGNTPDFP